ncbi:N-acetylmuramoyl-L-alanine amidase [Lentibacillus saliphilus]|uniref:N-acetylmuramoyl-L-alanine amidase n=1 Tax=Lentibacillus saliphilus TaxID=2737028 RepID=UPI001C2F57B0|nr:N-acetylmuramoyl-L-alanine amidase [Lentibacillus saliphilus]
MRFKWFALLSMMCMFGLAFFGSGQLFADTAVIKYDNLNVRSGPGTHYDKIGQVHSNEVVPVEATEDGWVKIRFNQQTGWVSADYVSIENEEKNDDTTEQNETTPNHAKEITIKSERVHLRNGPSTSYDIVSYAQQGDHLMVESQTGDWLKVTNEQMSGYIYEALIAKPHRSNDLLQNKTIVIDPGHGGRDVGAIGVGGTYEKNFAFKTALELAKELEYLGADVVMTRSEDHFKSLASRASLANTTDTDIFISLHYNSFPEYPTATGIQTYYYHAQDETLATFIQQGLIQESGNRDRGVTQENYLVIRQTFKPSILIELGFISNARSEQLLQTERYQQKLVKGITIGIQKYFKQLD